MPPIKYPQLYNRQILTKLIDDYGTDNAIAREIGCHSFTVTRARHRMGMKKSRGFQTLKYPQLHDPVALSRLLAECGSYTAAARKIGCDISTVCVAARGLRRRKRNDKQLRGGEQ